MSTAPAVLIGTTTSSLLRPRFEGSNICTWIGFKHVNYLVEEAVLSHVRDLGMSARDLFERYALGVDIVALKTRILVALHLDDLITAEVTALPDDGTGVARFAVSLSVDRDGMPTKAATSRVGVVFRLDPTTGPAEPPPGELRQYVTERIDLPGPDRRNTTPHPVVRHDDIGTDLGGDRCGAGGDTILRQLTGDANAFGWTWRIPYFYCHFSQRIQMSGYLRQMEEVVDLFLADRGISIKSMLDDRRWIPVVPESSVYVLDEALMEEDLHTVYTVTDVFKDLTYTARMDTYVVRDGVPVLTATGTITHGYAVIENRRDWRLVPFDDRVLLALQPSTG